MRSGPDPVLIMTMVLIVGVLFTYGVQSMAGM